MLVAEQTQLCGRAALCDPLPLRLEAIGALLPSCPPSFAHDERLEDAICRLVSQQVPVYHLECLPDAAAARLSCRTVFGDDAPNTLR